MPNKTRGPLPIISLLLLTVAAFAAILLWNAVWRSPQVATERPVTIGMITNNPNGVRNVLGFRDGLEALGFVEGETASYRFSGKPTPGDALEAAIAGMVAEGADLIFTAGTPTGVAAWKATRGTGVPVVFGVIADPVAAGVVTDLARPGGNMTGVMLSQNQARRLQLLRDLVPAAKRVLVPYNPDDPAPVSAAAQLDAAAAELELTLIHAHARNDAEVTALLAEMPADIDAIFMLPDSTVNRRVADLIAIANERGLAVSGPSTAQVEAGATMAYGIVHHEVGVQAAQIAARVLRGADPATMPVETADFYLTINIAAAERIGLDLDEEMLQLADVILREDKFGP